MKGRLAFDPDDYDYGVATAAIRSILVEWAEIDWFEATAAAGDQGASLFREHQRLAYAQRPDLFAETVEIRTVSGDRTEFIEWCNRVRSLTAGWDWKMGVLKTLSYDHARSREWTPAAEARRLPVGAPRPGDLFFKYAEDQVLWNSFSTALPGLDAGLQDAFAESAGFYRMYAHSDALDCMKWQLAEHSNDLTSNPFLPLIRCYAAGSYPFSSSRESVVMFRFQGATA